VLLFPVAEDGVGSHRPSNRSSHLGHGFDRLLSLLGREAAGESVSEAAEVDPRQVRMQCPKGLPHPEKGASRGDLPLLRLKVLRHSAKALEGVGL
jgi:hypothetical protein